MSEAWRDYCSQSNDVLVVQLSALTSGTFFFATAQGSPGADGAGSIQR
jgi:hypothetical protein